MRTHFKTIGVLALSLCFIAGIFVSRSVFHINGPPPDAQAATADTPNTPTTSRREPQLGAPGVPPALPFSLDAATRDGDHLVVRTDDGHRITLTLDPDLQDTMLDLYRRYEVPHAAFVAVEPSTGRVLALVGFELPDGAFGDLPLKATAPSASIFKTITATALLETHHIDPKKKICFPAGGVIPTEDDIIGRGAPDDGCADLGTAFGMSNNYVFTRLAYRHLSAQDLRDWSSRFAYNEIIPFNLPLEESLSTISDDPIQRAKTAAGFWNSMLTPLHAALIPATIANGGLMMRPNMFQEVADPQGNIIYSFAPLPYKTVMSPDTARQMADLMVFTTTVGTARNHMAKLPPNFIPAGKTGTLSHNDFMISWFVGFAPIEHPQVAIAVLLHNPPKWRIKSSFAAAHALQYLHQKLNPPPTQDPSQAPTDSPPEDPLLTTDAQEKTHQDPQLTPKDTPNKKPDSKKDDAKQTRKLKRNTTSPQDQPTDQPADRPTQDPQPPVQDPPALKKDQQGPPAALDD